MTVSRINAWFDHAVPEPTEQNKNTQMGVHIEELKELLDSCEGSDLESDDKLNNFKQLVHDFAESLKNGSIRLEVTDRVGFLDAICDGIVTGIGLTNYNRMNIISGLSEVAESNWSKFDTDGNPLFDENQKIQKGPLYFKPNLTEYV